MKIFGLLLAVFFVLTASVPVQADTVYLARPDGGGVQTISGTIVRETETSLTIKTEDGKSVSIRKADVLEIIRKPVSGSEGAAEPEAIVNDGNPGLEDDLRPDSREQCGLIAGMNIANLRVDPQSLEDEGSLSSYALGIWWHRPLSGRLMLHAEALYSVRGDAQNGDGYTVSTRLKYVDVSALPRIGLLPHSRVQPWLTIGPSLGIRLSASSTLEGDGSDVDVDVKDQVRVFDPAVVIGGGFDFGIGTRTYGIELRYSRGLTNIADETANGSAHSSVISILGEIGSR